MGGHEASGVGAPAVGAGSAAAVSHRTRRRVCVGRGGVHNALYLLLEHGHAVLTVVPSGPANEASPESHLRVVVGPHVVILILILILIVFVVILLRALLPAALLEGEVDAFLLFRVLPALGGRGGDGPRRGLLALGAGEPWGGGKREILQGSLRTTVFGLVDLLTLAQSLAEAVLACSAAACFHLLLLRRRRRRRRHRRRRQNRRCWASSSSSSRRSAAGCRRCPRRRRR